MRRAAAALLAVAACAAHGQPKREELPALAEMSGPFHGTWVHEARDVHDPPRQGTLTLLQYRQRVCGVWVSGARKRLLVGKLVDGGRVVEARMSGELEAGGAAPRTWGRTTALTRDQHRLATSLVAKGTHLRSDGIQVRVDETLARHCADKLRRDVVLPPPPRDEPPLPGETRPAPQRILDTGQGESIVFDREGRIKNLSCTPGVSRLAETRIPCGFDPSSPGHVRIHHYTGLIAATYVNGVEVRRTQYRGDTPGDPKYTLGVEGGVRTTRSYHANGKLEAESVTAVDAAGRDKHPLEQTIRGYHPSGARQAVVRESQGLLTVDIWHESGEKKRELRSARGTREIPGGNGRRAPVTVQTIRTFSPEGRLEKEEERVNWFNQ